jgi:hypothetical protein
MSFGSLIRYFVPTERLKRAEQIQDSELEITKRTNEQIEATIREYHVAINIPARTIMHDCADWGKVSSTKKLCKHVTKLFLSIDKQRATEILRSIYDNEEAWQFKPDVTK